MSELRSPLQAQVVQWLVGPGDTVREGDVVVILEAMKMEHELRSPAGGRVRERLFGEGETVQERELLLTIETVAGTAHGQRPAAQAPASPAPATRADLQRVLDRQGLTLDAARPQAVARRHALGLRTARENIADLCDPGSVTEYGALAVAAQRSRRSEDDRRVM